MEIIVCKAKSIEDKKWVYGYPVKHSDNTMCLFKDSGESVPVIPETLCYSTGEPDINGRELFIGDTINDFGGGVRKTDYDHPNYHPFQAFPPTKVVGDNTRLGHIVWEDGTVRIQTVGLSYCYNLSNASKLSEMEYRGNIWDEIHPCQGI